MNNKYKPVDEPYMKNTFRHELIKRNGNIALYKKTGMESNTRKYEVDSGYEVVRIRTHDGYELGGVKIDPAEVYPSNEKWGTDGYTYTGVNALEYANKRYNDMVAQESVTSVSANVSDDLGGDNAPTVESTEVKVKKKRGRAASVKPAIVFPTGLNFTMNSLLEMNTDYVKPTLYIEIQKLIELGKVKEVGNVKSEGGRGKPAKLYSVI
jgi:hypothetical protein